MKTKKIVLALVLVDFAALSVWAFAQLDLEMVGRLMREPIVMQLTADLVIALTLFCAWMWRDAKSRAMRPLPWILLTVGTGSIGALVYLLARERNPQRDASADLAFRQGLASVDRAAAVAS